MMVFRKSCSGFRQKIGIPCVTSFSFTCNKSYTEDTSKMVNQLVLKKSCSFPVKRASGQIILSYDGLYKRFRRRYGKQQE